ncbi:MAG: PepSY domain-containing protein [Bacteroidales bacterium]|nr:PepSY domain-containing protein [Bacteroidales bacterium]
MKTIRRIHRLTASFLSVALLLVAVSGILLGWKKNSNGYIHPDSYEGTTDDLSKWLPVDSLKTIAILTLRESGNEGLSEELERIDIRPDKGMVKFVFAHHYHGIQLDGATGRVLHRENRRSDLVEDIHDMSIVDKLLGIEGEVFKLVYTTFTGLSLLIFTITGIWLRYRSRNGNRKR